MAGLFRSIQFAAAAMAVVLLNVGCGAPDPSFAGLSDDQLKALFPSDAEVKSILGPEAELYEPRVMDLSVASPDPSRTMEAGKSENCRDAYFGTDETRSIEVTRGFDLEGTEASNSIDFPKWHLRQHPSAKEARRFIDVHDKISKKCEWYEMFPLAIDHSMGRSMDLRALGDVGDVHYGASLAIAVGDLSMTFGLSSTSREEAVEKSKKMAGVIERRLQASAPK